MKEQILELLTANNYPLGEDSDDVQCANQIDTLTCTRYLQFAEWCVNNITEEFPVGLRILNEPYLVNSFEQVYDYWINLNL
jgi:hypothetical protein